MCVILSYGLEYMMALVCNDWMATPTSGELLLFRLHVLGVKQVR